MLSASSLAQKAMIGAAATLSAAPAPQPQNLQDQYLIVGGYDNLMFEVLKDGGRDPIVGISFSHSKSFRGVLGKQGEAFVKMSGDLCLHRCTLHTKQGNQYRLFIQVKGWGDAHLKRFTLIPQESRLGFKIIHQA